MMATYLIDYESVQHHGLAGILKLSDKDTVVVFVGNQTKHVPVEAVSHLLRSPAQVTIKKLKKTSKNYLDFQLATCLGSLVERGIDQEFCIVSKDHDYEPVIDYWQRHKAKVRIERRETIALAASPPAAKLNNETKK